MDTLQATAPQTLTGASTQGGAQTSSLALRNTPSRQVRHAPPGREYLTFRLGSEEYGIDILKVQEIRSYEPPTKIANAPSYLKGVVNLRGVIVPIVDLRIKFNCLNANGEAEINSFTVVIVLNVRGRVVGAVVDSVSDVMQLTEQMIQPAPEMSNSIVDTTYITGIANVSDRLLILMDIESLMGSAEMGLINSLSAT
ncbi:chemotaxis protein CheW [Aquabacterium sp.]|jgi:purine-binding chemotaxis protein CheW|uniref:chemotaxis protein CheW n=1 Tax=Aquabacterium sp. TaxID=1872578 RepID=UPI0011D3C7E6|nr:chemotaxis protein CheW [Aquabacterium sp.]MBP6611964.1 chemotaxis protein CheW [Aquabacterium sp.]MBP7501671.1 chemotaxis protein CheW [Aquabacterium sp.]MCC6219246.1 chemotaxis protein CheW [Aquabacterium sp.]MDD2975278.1 chemotaxis protein CheW [Aquabacterium sp.]TXI96120.1 MAG: chemotaxis protein CheW [Aquabacterium sp.]